MKLIYNWKKVMRKAWSVRLMLLAAILSAAEVALPLIPNNLPRGIFAAVSGCTVAAAFVARLLAQKELDNEE